ncbi:hypothetical protein AB0M29_45065 [Streptomyces sp. NPDC051976]|uniref:hypothetical protein n=1 Tax=Streptomyces sp. NPDC051976 TaxID=3154947 RepID=UPI00341AF6F5
MIRIQKLLSNRLAKLSAAAISALAMLLGGTGTAHAAIYWSGIQMVNQASQQCLRAEGYPGGVSDGNAGTTIPGCMHDGTSWIWLSSAAPDNDGDAQVQIETESDTGELLCLHGDYPDTGPNGPTSSSTYWAQCGYGGAPEAPLMLWRMHTVAPPQNVGNPEGLKHFISFYNDAYGVCLDGGFDEAYGFPGHCNSSNNWQIWNIYTNQTSHPYGG